MTSKSAYQDAYVWCWLPGASEPTVAGRLVNERGALHFNYGQRYLENRQAIALYAPELPLRAGRLPLLHDFTMPQCLRDAAPDAWGRRVIINRRFGLAAVHTMEAQLDELTYLLESGSDRIGALDFQQSPSEYVPRLHDRASLEELQDAAERVQRGVALPPGLEQALQHGTSIGGARPKVLLEARQRKWIAKFATSADLYSIVKAEFIAMRLANIAGLHVAPVELTQAAGKDILLVERFDRLHTAQGWQRRAMVSALTMLGLHEMLARYASYQKLAELVRHRFADATSTLRELFCRLVFNILCGNTDDHARNHAAFWDGHLLRLTPAYDLCPQARAGNEASQAMLIVGNNNLSRLSNCLQAAHHFHLSEVQALQIMEQQLLSIAQHWQALCEQTQLSVIDQRLLWGRAWLNPFAVDDLTGAALAIKKMADDVRATGQR
jgi:serine/threonine-protein kinase HipA